MSTMAYAWSFAMLASLLTACGGSGGTEDSGQVVAGDATTQAGFYAPDYGSASGSSTYETDLSGQTARVLAYQDRGSELLYALIPAYGQLIQILGSYKVQLIEQAKMSCPSGVEGCNTTDSAQLGVGTNALITSVHNLQSTIRDQGERGTCVSFALNAALELLLDRAGINSNLSEQLTYFQGKRLTDSWNSAGLSAYNTVKDVVATDTRFVEETYWPYNTEDKSCTNYQTNYPDATCSETEAQGGGNDHRQADPHTTQASGYGVRTAHELYASLGRVKQALYRGYPVILAVNANYDFQLATYKGGVVSWALRADDCGTSLCGHAILAVGYQDDDQVQGGGYVIVKNSWTSDWGDGGLAYVTYEWLENSLLDAQAIVTLQANP